MKIIVTFIIAVIMTFAASAKTWENFVTVGVRIPGNSPKLEMERSSDAVKIGPVAGFDFSYIGVHENGFTLKGMFDFNYADSDIEPFANFGNLDGGNIEMLLGCGYAPVHDDNMLLGFYGILGISYFRFGASREFLGIKNEKNWEFVLPVMGANGTFVYTFSKSFSVYGSMTAEILLPGSLEYKFDDYTYKADTKSSFILVPALGVSWKF